ncbi:hypothetical protein [Cupriavidus necator]
MAHFHFGLQEAGRGAALSTSGTPRPGSATLLLPEVCHLGKRAAAALYSAVMEFFDAVPLRTGRLPSPKP